MKGKHVTDFSTTESLFQDVLNLTPLVYTTFIAIIIFHFNNFYSSEIKLKYNC